MTVDALVRQVRPFVELGACEHDMQERGNCSIYDLHGLWWTVPKELTGFQVDEQIAEALDELGARAFHGDPIKPHQHTVPSRLCGIEFLGAPCRRPYGHRGGHVVTVPE